MARKNHRSKGLSGQALKSYRHNLSILKKKGLVSPKIDARSHKPTRYMLAKIKSLKNVLEGREKALKVSQKSARAYKEDPNIRIVRNRVIVPIDTADKKTRVLKGMLATKRVLATGEREVIRLPRRLGLLGLMQELEKPTFDFHKNPNDKFAFEIYSNMSAQFFGTAKQMKEYLEKYLIFEDIQNSKPRHAAKKAADFYQGLVIVRYNIEHRPYQKAIDKHNIIRFGKTTQRGGRSVVKGKPGRPSTGYDDATYERNKRAERKIMGGQEYEDWKLKERNRKREARARKRQK